MKTGLQANVWIHHDDETNVHIAATKRASLELAKEIKRLGFEGQHQFYPQPFGTSKYKLREADRTTQYTELTLLSVQNLESGLGVETSGKRMRITFSTAVSAELAEAFLSLSEGDTDWSWGNGDGTWRLSFWDFDSW